jgi:hypothetical protein
MLEFKTALLAVTATTDYDERCHESDHLEISAEFLGVPDLSVLSFEGFTAARLSVDFEKALTAKGFSCVEH